MCTTRTVRLPVSTIVVTPTDMCTGVGVAIVEVRMNRPPAYVYVDNRCSIVGRYIRLCSRVWCCNWYVRPGIRYIYIYDCVLVYGFVIATYVPVYSFDNGFEVT